MSRGDTQFIASAGAFLVPFLIGVAIGPTAMAIGGVAGLILSALTFQKSEGR